MEQFCVYVCCIYITVQKATWHTELVMATV